MSIKAVYTDKRQFNRIAFDAPVTIHSEDGDWGSCLIDISLKGVLIRKPENWNHSDNDEFDSFILFYFSGYPLSILFLVTYSLSI